MVALKSSEIESFVARPDPARAVVLVFGPDAGLVSERADAIIRASVDDPTDPFALVRLDGDALASDPARLIDEATTIPLFGGRRAIPVRDGRASRAELRKLALYAQGQERVEIDDVMAVVTDASALALDSLIDAAFAGRLADLEKEFAKAAIAGTNPTTIVGAALRQLERLHVLSLEIAGGASVSDVVARPQSGIHFRRQDAFTKALRGWTPERLAKAMSMLAEASLDARRQSDLAETIAQRALMQIARSAARRE